MHKAQNRRARGDEDGAGTPIRKRLAPTIRKERIIDAAARLVVEQGFLPLSMEKLAKAAGASKALVYNYFSDQHVLMNAVLERELNRLFASGFEKASQIRDFDQAALACAQCYFEHVARRGPLLPVLMTDRYMTGRLAQRSVRLRHEVLQRLLRQSKRVLSLSRREVAAALEMMTAIPEEAGRLVFRRELDYEVGRELCRSLMASALQALRAPARSLADIASAGDVARSLHDHRET